MIKRQTVPVETVANDEITLNSETPKKIHIQYERPVPSKRLFSSILDFLVFALIASLIFLGTRAIMEVTPSYKANEETYQSIQVNSGLYQKSTNGYYYNIFHYYELQDNDSTFEKIKLRNAIDAFIKYSNEQSDTHKVDVQKEYDNYRVNLKVDGVNYFMVENSEIKEVSGIPSSSFNKNAYGPFIEEKCCAIYLVENFTQFVNSQKAITYGLIFIDLPISVILAAILSFYVPGLIFKRGRKSLGKLLFHISLVDKNYLSLPLKTYTYRFLIILFGEIILSFATFGVPLLISASFEAFSKKKQPIHDYLLKIDSLDTSTDKVYFSKQEIAHEQENTNKTVDFKLR